MLIVSYFPSDENNSSYNRENSLLKRYKVQFGNVLELQEFILNTVKDRTKTPRNSSTGCSQELK